MANKNPFELAVEAEQKTSGSKNPFELAVEAESSEPSPVAGENIPSFVTQPVEQTVSEFTPEAPFDDSVVPKKDIFKIEDGDIQPKAKLLPAQEWTGSTGSIGVVERIPDSGNISIPAMGDFPAWPETENRAGYIYNKFLGGIGKSTAAVGDIMSQIMVQIPGMLPPGMTPEEGLKELRGEFATSLREGTTKLLGDDIAKEKVDKYDKEFTTSVIGGVFESSTAMVSLYGSGMLFQAYDNALESINSTPQGKDLPESTKTIFATGVGMAQAVLEKLALNKIFGKASDKVSQKVAFDTFNDLLKKQAGKEITSEMFEAALYVSMKDLKKKIVSGGSKVATAYAVEFTTGGLQELSTVMAERFLNETQGKEIFEPQSFGATVGRIFEAAKAEGAGGLILGGVSIPLSKTPNYISDKVSEAKTQEDIDALKVELTTQAQSKGMSQGQLDQFIGIVDDYARINNKIPAEVPNRKETIDSIKERESIQQEVEKKTTEMESVDEAFQPQLQAEIDLLNQRVKEINEQIINPKQDETKEAETKTEAKVLTPEETQPVVEPVKPESNEAENIEGESLGENKAEGVVQEESETAVKLKSAASFLRKAKITEDVKLFGQTLISVGDTKKLGGGFENVWNGAIEAAATVLEGTAKLSDAINSGLTHIKESDWYKGLDNKSKKKVESRYNSHIKDVLSGQGLDAKKIVKEETIERKKAAKAQVRETTGQKDMSEKKTMTEKQLLKEQIGNQAKGSKTGAKAQQNVVKSLTDLFNESLTAKKITDRQAKALTKTLAKVKVDNNKSIDNFLEIADKIIEDADFSEKVDEVKGLSKKVKDLKKKGFTLNVDNAILSEISSLNPEKVSDLGTLKDILNDIHDSRTGKQGGRKYTSEQIYDFIEKEKGFIKSEKDKKLIEAYKELTGEEDNVPMEVIEDFFRNDNANINIKFAENIKRKLETIAAVAKDDLNNIKENFTGRDRADIDALIDVDLQSLSINDLKRFNNVVNEIVYEGNLFDTKYFVAKSKAKSIVSDFMKSDWKEKIRNIVSTKNATAREITKALKDISESGKVFQMLSADRRVGKEIYEKVVGQMQRGYVRANNEYHKHVDNLIKLTDGVNEESRVKIFFVAALNNHLGGDQNTINEQFAQNKSKILSNIKNKLASGDLLLIRKGELEMRVFNEIEKAIKPPTESSPDLSLLNKKERDLYQYISDFYEQNKSSVKEDAERFHGENFMEWKNYIPFVVKSIKGAGKLEGEVDITEDLQRNPDRIKIEMLGRAYRRADYDKLLENKYFETDIVNVFKDTASDILYEKHTKEGRMIAQEVFNNKDFTKLVGSQNRDILLDRVKTNYLMQKGIKYDRGFIKYFDFLKRAAITKVLGSPDAIIKETVPLYVQLLSSLKNPSVMGQVLANRAKMFGKTAEAYKNLLEKVGADVVIRTTMGDMDLDKNIKSTLSPEYNSLVDNAAKAQQLVQDVSMLMRKLGDRIVSVDIWMSSYIDDLINKGTITKASEFDPEKHIDLESARHADSEVTRLNNISDISNTPKAFIAKSQGEEAMLSMIFPFMKYPVNQLAENALAVRNFFDDHGSKEDSTRQLAGSFLNQATFLGISMYLTAPMYGWLSDQISNAMGDDDEDKDRFAITDEKNESFIARLVANNMFNGLPPIMATPMQMVIDRERQKKALRNDEKFKPLFYKDDLDLAEMFPIYGIALQKGVDIANSTADVVQENEEDQFKGLASNRALFSTWLSLASLLGYVPLGGARVVESVSRDMNREYGKFQEKKFRFFKSEGGGEKKEKRD